ncbi:hypothetical protein B4U80_03574 [Leptotrombidium deliense]|uniref:Uncharacterized protein n=1 Tax=Leptotrombidium deliense TaxID=299467 RepID=A0A443SKM4_9ACAR|nr:hypothetical protein B4U80_03574 [Leptotrombidium deliense]
MESTGRAYEAKAAQQTSPGALLMCDIKEVYPSPDVTIYRVDSDGSNPFLLDVHRTEQVLQQNLLRVLVTVNVNDVQLLERFGGQPSIFECLVTIPLPDKKNLYYKKQITYIPGESCFNSFA